MYGIWLTFLSRATYISVLTGCIMLLTYTRVRGFLLKLFSSTVLQHVLSGYHLKIVFFSDGSTMKIPRPLLEDMNFSVSTRCHYQSCDTYRTSCICYSPLCLPIAYRGTVSIVTPRQTITDTHINTNGQFRVAS